VDQKKTMNVDLLVDAWYVVTMNESRDIIHRGSLAIRDDIIIDVGKTSELETKYIPKRRIGGDRFVVTPGMINTHIHITGEPITRGYVPDDTPFMENVFVWLCTLYSVQRPEEEIASAKLASVEMLRSGTTCFLEAGTILHFDEVFAELSTIGIRGRVGSWVWDIPPEPSVYRQSTDQAITKLQRQLEKYHCPNDLLSAWSILVGHTTCSDPLWKAAKTFSDQYDVGMSFHMSPAEMDPEGFITSFGQRPIVHLADIGVLDHKCALTHAVRVSDAEIDILAKVGASIAHCPTTALKVSYGITQVGKFPEMVQKGINVSLGTDGNNASNYSDLMRAAYLVAGLFKDAREDPQMFPAEKAFEMATIDGAKTMLMQDQIGSLEVGKKADLVLHDTDRPEWRPLLNVMNQLVWSADGRGVHTVLVDGKIVVEDYRCITLDEERLWADVQSMGEAVAGRSGLPDKAKYPTL
jgi:5-methylthioadenosine/S-adenosylhomocysteine deaminase